MSTIHSFQNRSNAKTNLRKARGFTLIELMLVIAGAVALIGIGLGIYNKVQSSSGGLAGSTGLLQLSSGIKQLYPSPNFTGVSVQTLIDAKKAPDGMISGTSLVNSWGGTITVAPANYNGGTNNAVAITMTGVPTEACNNLAAAVQGNFQVISVGAGAGTVVKNDASNVTYSVAAVAAACKDSNSNTMTFTTT